MSEHNNPEWTPLDMFLAIAAAVVIPVFVYTLVWWPIKVLLAIGAATSGSQE